MRTNKAKEIIDELVYRFDQVIVDNDFESAYNIPFDAFKKFSRKDIIEALFLELAILYENVPEVKDYLKENSNRKGE